MLWKKEKEKRQIIYKDYYKLQGCDCMNLSKLAKQYMHLSRFKNYGLWVSVFSFIVLICEGYNLDILPSNFQDIVQCILSILVFAGFVNNPDTENKGYLDDNK